MLIAKQKRTENIAEYILYIWQLEDLLRALNFDAGRIYASLVEPQKELDEDQKQTVFFWYIDIVNILKTEGKTEVGHIDHSLHLIADLNDLHLLLLKNDIEASKSYKLKYEAVKEELPKIKEQFHTKDISDIEACFKVLYSVVLMRLKGEDKKYINDALELISPLLAELSMIYKQAEKGQLDLFENTK
ncbi:MAG: DUF4924 family protein [Rikenellaceae bacterium]